MAKRTTGNSAGIVITPRAIVGIQANSRDGGIEVKVRGAVETPPDTMAGQEVIDPIRLGHALRSLWRRTSMGETAASVSLMAPAYGLRALRMPLAPERERHALVRGELEQAQVIPREGGAFDFIWVSATEASSPQADIYAYHTSDNMIDGFRRAFQVAGLKLAAVEPTSIAMMRVFLATRDKRDPVAILCPSARHTDLCIHDGTRVRQVRRIPAGWEDLGRAPERGTRDLVPQSPAWEKHVPGERRGGSLNLAEGEALPEGEAEGAEAATEAAEEAPAERQSFQGFPTVWPSRDGLPEAEEESDALPLSGGQAVQKSDFLVSEITRTLAFFERENPEEAHPREIVVLGPVEAGRGFERVLTPAQAIPVVIGDPTAGVDMPRAVAVPGLEEESEAYVAALGVALADAELGMPRVDVSQQSKAAHTGRRAPQVLRAGMAWSTLWLVAASVAAIGLMLMESRLADEHIELTNEIERIHAERAPLVRRAELTKAAEAARQAAEIPAAPVLGRVAAATTTGVGLTSLRMMPGGKVMIEGKALGTSNIQRFALSVGRGKSVQLPIIETTKRDNQGQVTFRIGALFRESTPPPAPATDKE